MIRAFCRGKKQELVLPREKPASLSLHLLRLNKRRSPKPDGITFTVRPFFIIQERDKATIRAFRGTGEEGFLWQIIAHESDFKRRWQHWRERMHAQIPRAENVARRVLHRHCLYRHPSLVRSNNRTTGTSSVRLITLEMIRSKYSHSFVHHAYKRCNGFLHFEISVIPEEDIRKILRHSLCVLNCQQIYVRWIMHLFGTWFYIVIIS